ncbi:MAG: DUF499 domain-containing protein [Deltaproteobacteria bacterium]|nr:DUF499 domain-containing protein [Deltaproteobacteria bacterium]
MAISNSERIGKGLELLRDGLAPFVEREMQAEYKDRWQDVVQQNIPRDFNVKDGKIQWDIHPLLLLTWDQWNAVFKNILGHTERSFVSELREIRNKWAHQETFSYDDTYRALDTMVRLLKSISAPEAAEVEKISQETMRVRFAEQARQETRKKVSIEGTPESGLRPWREVVTPHPDVAKGRYVQAEFAADLAQVLSGDASAEYGDAHEFYRRTYITEGLSNLLKEAIARLNKTGGSPVVELQTNFGGGKTHSMLALYHLFSGTAGSELAGVDQILQQLSIKELPKACRAVLVGTSLNPGQPHTKDDGTIIRTLWGELAWQLGGRDAYAMVALNDENGTSPGSQTLGELFKKHSPCIILIDEWVAYVRQAYGKTDLSGGSFDANMTFAQALTEAVRATPGAILVASLPASQIEIGGEGGKDALTRLQTTFGRMQSPWRSASAEESFEIVRRRLFEPIADPKDFAAKDAVIKMFSQYYQANKSEFPHGCGEVEYRKRMEKAYPIHPELFDRLYEDWSSLERFQRTRGVLRLMATVISELWDRQDANLLIMPSTVPMDDSGVQSELTRYLGDSWRPVIEKDVDGPEALSLKIDRELPNIGRYSAARRVARSIYIGSAPLEKAAHKGIDERRIKLGCAQPGENVATFGDALRRLTDRATHLYLDGKTYWFSTQPSVTRLAEERATQFEEHVIWDELKTRIRADRQRGDFSAVHAVPDSSGDVPDEMETRLVILGPESYHMNNKAQDTPAQRSAQDILNNRGNSPRIYRNMLVFLAPDKARLDELEQAIRIHRAWKSICDDKEALNLDMNQSKQGQTKCTQTDGVVNTRIRETFIWLLVPDQPDPQRKMQWQQARITGQDTLAVKASKKLLHDENLFAEYSAIRIRFELDRFLWTESNHIGIRKLWEYFATYLYLPRLRNSTVLINAIQDGVEKITWEENFAYATAYDLESNRYSGLVAGSMTSIIMDTQSVLVKPEAAKRQMQMDEDRRRAEQEKTSGEKGETRPPSEGGEEGDVQPPIPKTHALPRRFFGTVSLDALRLSRDAGNIADEVVQHFCALVGCDVEVTLEIHARIPDGASDNLVRTVTENCNTLRFSNYGFEEE